MSKYLPTLSNRKAIIDNKLIWSGYSLGEVERAIIYLTLSNLDSKQHIEDKYYSFPIEKYANLREISLKEAKKILRNGLDSLMSATICQKNGDMEYLFHWIDSAYFNNATNEVSIKWSSDIIEYISELQKNFTQIKIDQIISLRSKYAQRFYELFLSEKYKKLNILEISLIELKYLLQLPSIYEEYKHFKQKILCPTIKQLEELVAINILSENKIGRSVVSLTFQYRFMDS
jgi:plasmid replication initiation protein